MNPIVVVSIVLLAATGNPPSHADAPQAPAPKATRTARASHAPGPAAKPAPDRELRRRHLKITDASADAIPEVHVAGGTPTTVSFPIPIQPNGTLLAGQDAAFFPPRVMERAIIVIPRRDLATHEVASLTVTLIDGTLLTFKLASSPDDADLEVEVELLLEKKASPASARALKDTVSDLKSRLDECQASSGSAGIAKVASLIAAQDFAKPEAFAAERRSIHRLDKDARLLIEAKAVYRLFGLTYLVVTVENRDDRPWTFDHAGIEVRGGGSPSEVAVTAAVDDPPSLAPDAEGRIVIVFASPDRRGGEHLALRLFEKAGSRHATLDDLPL